MITSPGQNRGRRGYHPTNAPADSKRWRGHRRLIAKLKTLTNLRVVRDEESTTGWKLEVGPFPGWETVPTW
jgi:hypothetical protein